MGGDQCQNSNTGRVNAREYEKYECDNMYMEKRAILKKYGVRGNETSGYQNSSKKLVGLLYSLSTGCDFAY